MRQELQDLQRALPEVVRSSLDIGVEGFGIVDRLHARGKERIAVQELQHTESLDAAADGVVRAVGGGDVAQHGGRSADPVQVIGARFFDLGLALQENAEWALQPRGFLRGGARALATHRERDHGSGEEHDVPHRHDGDGIVGQRARR